MRRSKQRQKERKRRRGRLIFLLLLLLLGTACWYGYHRISAEIDTAAESFMDYVNAGDAAGAASLLLDKEGGEAGLTSLITLFQGHDFTFRSTGRSRPTGLISGTAVLYFNSGGTLHTAPLRLVRRGRDWLIGTLPEVKIMTGALIEKAEPSTVQLFWQNERIELPAPAGLTVEAGAVARVQLFGDAAVIEPLEEIHLSRLLRFSDTKCEGELEGNLPLEPPLSVYLVDPGTAYQAEQGSTQDLIVGMSDLALYLSAGKVVAARVEKGFSPGTIRVLLRQNLNQLSDESLFHRQLRLNSKNNYTLDDKRSGVLFTFEPGQNVLIEPSGETIKVTPEGLDSIIFQHRIFFSAHQNGTMIIENLARDGWPGGNPAYRGILEIANQDGRLIVINEPTLEEYLYTVVPSEMPAGFGLEALKTQAVAARSYAYRSILSSGYSRYGAHVDDSVMSQVYNNAPEQPAATEAVMATAGMILFYGDQAADARFFSTSCGFTANYHEVWHDPVTGSFPAGPVPYLKAVSQIPGEKFNLESEEEMAGFLRRGDWAGYDRTSPYFRWSVEMSGEQLTAAINQNLAHRYREQPEFILTGEDGKFNSIEIPRNPLGRLKDIRVCRRGAGGNIMVLEVEGTNGTYQIMKEYNIRFTLRPVNYLPGSTPVILKRHDGSRVQDYAILPSAFACIDVERDESGEITRVLISGGGNGHGVGMSQYGARGMAEQGYDFREILRHYYPGAELSRICEP